MPHPLFRLVTFSAARVERQHLVIEPAYHILIKLPTILLVARLEFGKRRGVRLVKLFADIRALAQYPLRVPIQFVHLFGMALGRAETVSPVHDLRVARLAKHGSRLE